MAGPLQPPVIFSNPAAFNPLDKSVWEWIVGDEAPDEDTISADQSHAVMSGYLKDFSLLYDAVAYFVGYASTGQNTLRVNRHNPAIHPRWPYLRCSVVSVKGVKFDGELVRLAGAYNPSRRFKLPVYERYRFDVHFEFPQFNYKEDSEVATEWDRCLTIDPTDEGELVVVDGGQYKLRATGTFFDNFLNTINAPYFRVHAQRSGLIVRAYGLPADFLLNDYGIAVHFLAAKGKVNSTTFLGLPAGTMLLQDWRIIKTAQPVATQFFGALSFGVTAEMHFGYTDPERGLPGETLRGWQLVPGPGGISGSWYAAINTTTGEPIYDEYDHNRLLQHWST